MNSPSELRKAEAVVAGIIRERQPLPVELLADEHRRLAEALDAKPPIPASLGEECANDLRRINSERKEGQ